VPSKERIEEQAASTNGSVPPNASGALAMPQDLWHGTADTVTHYGRRLGP